MSSMIKLSVPARSGYLAPIRAAVMAASGRLPIDHVEDLGLAVGEAAGDLVRLGSRGRLTLVAAIGERVSVDVAVDSLDEGSSGGWGDPLTLMVLERLTDGLHRHISNGDASIRFDFPARS